MQHDPLDAALERALDHARRLAQALADTPGAGAPADLLALRSALLDARQARLEETRAARAPATDPRSVSFDGLVCWLRDGDADGSGTGPFCPVCWDGGRRLVRLQRADPDYFDGWECRQCVNHFGRRRAQPRYATTGEGTRIW